MPQVFCTALGVTLTLLLGLEFWGVIFPWNSVKVICLLVFGLVIGGCFLYNEAKFARYPVMPLRLFKFKSNIAALLVGFLHGVVCPVICEYVRRFDMLTTCEVILCCIILRALVWSGCSGVLSTRIGYFRSSI
jgi:hypothetical protein